MTDGNQFIEAIQTTEFIGILVLMTSTFLIGYFSSLFLEKNRSRAIIERLKKEVNNLKIEIAKTKDIETIFTEIKPQIIKVVKESQQTVKNTSSTTINKEIEKDNHAITSKKAVVDRARSEYVNYTPQTPLLDFNTIGHGSSSTKDPLTEIEGIGPYIEEKLNEIGIYNFSQISNLEIKDIRVLTKLIDFFPGRIERDNWVGQAKSLSLTK